MFLVASEKAKEKKPKRAHQSLISSDICGVGSSRLFRQTPYMAAGCGPHRQTNFMG